MPSAMTDISDGLSRDLANILDASQCGAVINRHAIPIHPAAVEYAKQTGCEPIWHALNDGEDFELLFTIAPAEWHVLRAQWKLATALSVIGKIEGSGLVVDDGDSRRPLLPGGFEHGED